MTMQLIAILASAGLVTAGVAATGQTRSGAAIPAATFVTGAKARSAPGVIAAGQGGGVDCSLPENAALAACAAPGRGDRGVSGLVIGAGALGLIGAGVVIAAKNDENEVPSDSNG